MTIRTLICAVPVLLLAACGPVDRTGQVESAWASEVAYDAGVKLGGCAIGDLDPTRPGPEIAAVAVDGAVFLVAPEGDGWAHEKIAQFGGEMIQCAIGDVMPDHDGLELVVVGMFEGTEEDGGAGAAHIVYRGPDGWVDEDLAGDSALIHGVCIGDLDPERPGNEVLLVGFSRVATLVTRLSGPEGTGWGTETVGRLNGAGKAAIAYEGGAAVGCANGEILHLVKKDGEWGATVIDQADAGQSRITTDGSRLLVARDDGVLSLITAGEREEIHREQEKLRGAVLAELDDRGEGLEAATAGYGMKVTVLLLSDGKWLAKTVFTDTARLHHLAAGTFAGRDFVELVTCGFSGRVTVIHKSR